MPSLLARVLSDLHLDASPMSPLASLGAEVALVAGDVRNGRPDDLISELDALLPEPLILFVPGNHEGYGMLDWSSMVEQLRSASSGSRVHVLHRDTFQLGDVAFIGATLWTDFALFGEEHRPFVAGLCQSSIADYRRIGVDGYQLRASQSSRWHHEERAFIGTALARSASSRARVVITHHAPSRQSVSPRFPGSSLSASFVSDLPSDEISRANFWIHGHLHDSFDYPLGSCRVLCNPRGYSDTADASPENPAFNSSLLIRI